MLSWAANELGAHFILSEGIVHVVQPAQAISAARGVFPGDPWSVAALHVVTTLTGSALLALALLLGRQSLSSKLVIDFAISLPALFAGSLLGILAFRSINEAGFRRIILVLLLLSGASLALA